jgi:Reverse transcriptase (RNA-dependent DNA polymerase)
MKIILIHDKDFLINLNIYYQQVGNQNFNSNNIKFDDNVQSIFSFYDIDDNIISNLLNSISTKAIGCDNISSTILKLSKHILSLFTEIINISLNKGIFPQNWKKAHILPIPKIINPIEYADFRPISILPCASKLIEKVVHQQLSNYLNENNLFSNEQSGFRKLHSTTTLLLNITSDVYEAMDNDKLTSLIFLDFSKAFDTVNHLLLLKALFELGVSDSSYNWFESYLKDRQHKTTSNDICSNWINVLNGVPQGSILGPLLFSIYTRKLPSIFNYLKCFMFADDTQLLISYKANEADEIFKKINEDLKILQNWCENMHLKLNPKKCVHLIIGSKKNLTKLNKISLSDIKIFDNIIPRCNNIRNLGLVFDENMTWDFHINNIIKSSYATLKQFYHYKNFFSKQIKITLVNSLILPKFDYCDVVFVHMSCHLKNKLQKVQNMCLRFIFNKKKFDHISSHYNELGWLKLEKRRDLHMGCLIYKIKQNKTPIYLYNMLLDSNDIHGHNTRTQFFIPSINNNYGKRMFKFFGPQFWNSIPKVIRDENTFYKFKSKFSTFLSQNL